MNAAERKELKRSKNSTITWKTRAISYRAQVRRLKANNKELKKQRSKKSIDFPQFESIYNLFGFLPIHTQNSELFQAIFRTF